MGKLKRSHSSHKKRNPSVHSGYARIIPPLPPDGERTHCRNRGTLVCCIGCGDAAANTCIERLVSWLTLCLPANIVLQQTSPS